MKIYGYFTVENSRRKTVTTSHLRLHRGEHKIAIAASHKARSWSDALCKILRRQKIRAHAMDLSSDGKGIET